MSYAALGAESKVAIDMLRKEGKRVGLARLRAFRPFPSEDILSLAENADLIVIDRSISIGFEGPLFTEVKSCLYGKSDARVYGFIAGLGGKDVRYTDIGKIVDRVMERKQDGFLWYDMEGGK